MNYDFEDKNIILFDGVCNLCNTSVNFVIDHDKQKVFHFASLQSSFGQFFCQKYNLPSTNFNSFIYFKKGVLYKKSRAALEVSKTLKGFWQIAYVFVLVPSLVRDAVYNYISKNRYVFFGKKEACRLPTPDLKERFL
jgi:predicted DCC family thiol-disulfide oxidoreductase YuxK